MNHQKILPPSAAPDPPLPLWVVVHPGRGLPTNPPLEADVVVPVPEGGELPAEVAEGSEVEPTHEFLRQDAVKPLELPSPSRVIRSTIDHLGSRLLAEASELLRDEATPVVPINCLRISPALEGPPEVVDCLPSPLGGHPYRLNSGGVVSCVPVESYPGSFNTTAPLPKL